MKKPVAAAEAPSGENGAAKEEHQSFIADLEVLSSKFVPRVAASVQMVDGQHEYVFLTAVQPSDGTDGLVVARWAVTWQHFQRMYVLFRRLLIRYEVDLPALDLKATELEKEFKATIGKPGSKV